MRKKLFLFIATALLSVNFAEARETGYQGEVTVGYSFCLKDTNLSSMNVHFVNSGSLGQYFSMGVGLGIDYYKGLPKHGVIIPLFFDMKGYIPVGEKVELFISGDIGFGFRCGEISLSPDDANSMDDTTRAHHHHGRWYDDDNYDNGSPSDGGGYIAAAVGCMFPVGRTDNNIVVSLGYNFYNIVNVNFLAHSAALNVGFWF